MADMLVRLYDLPDVESVMGRMGDEGIVIRRVNPWEAGPLQATCSGTGCPGSGRGTRGAPVSPCGLAPPPAPRVLPASRSRPL